MNQTTSHTPSNCAYSAAPRFQTVAFAAVNAISSEGADPSDGIVLEACRTRGDLLNPARFFGGALKMVPNMLRIANDIKGFLDMKRTETFYATEYHLRS